MRSEEPLFIYVPPTQEKWLKKLVSVLATFALVTGARKEAPKVILDLVSCIHYLVQFWKDKKATIQALIDSGSEVNTMTPAYAKKLGLRI